MKTINNHRIVHNIKAIKSLNTKKGSRKFLKTFGVLTLVALLLGVTNIFTVVNAAGPNDIVAYRTNQNFILDGTPTEAFWQEIPENIVPLVATTTYGGAVPEMSVKAVHDGTNLYLLLRWADNAESRKLDGAIRIALSEPGNLVGGYFYNETHYYTDSAQVTWWLGSDEPTVSPAINNEFGPAPTRTTTLFGWGPDDTAETWSWKPYSLDQGNLYWPDAGLDPALGIAPVTTWHWGDKAGEAYTMPHSSLYQAHWSTAGNMVLGDGLLHAEGCQIPGTNNFEVKARGVWNDGEWTLEIAKAFVPSAENAPFSTEFKVGETFHLVLGAMDGNVGEWEEVGSMSDWLSLTISNELLPSEKLAVDTQIAIVEANNVANEALAEAEEANDKALEAEEAANEAQTIGESNEMALQIAQAAANDAKTTADNALQASEDAQAAADSANTLTYAAMVIAIIAIAVAAYMGIKKR